MSKKQALRDLVTERLVAAADEIFALIEEAFAEYEEEVLRLTWAKVQEQKNVRHKEGVQTPSGANHAEEEQTPCDSLDLPFSPLKPEDNINKLSLLQDKTTEENRTGAAEGEPGCSSGSRPARNEKPPSGSDTDDSRDWDTSAGKTTRSNDGESDAAHGKASPSRKRRKHRKRQHNELNESFVTVKREREEELEAYMQSGTICDSALTDASLAQTSAHAPSPSWISLLSQPPQSTDTVALMHEMLAKQDVLLQQQGQIFTLLSASQLQAPECSLDYKDLPIRDHQGLTGMEVRLQDQDYRTKLINHLSLIGGTDVRDTVFRIMKRVVSHSLATKTNWRGINGKSPFASLQLKDVIIAAVWKNPITPTASACEVEKYMKRWLQMAMDREGGRRRRAKPQD